jgi:hypothetical protein
MIEKQLLLLPLLIVNTYTFKQKPIIPNNIHRSFYLFSYVILAYNLKVHHKS